MHLDLICPICHCELQAARILGVKQISICFICRPGDMHLYIWFGVIIVVQDIAILCEKDVECLWINGRQMGSESFMRNNAALPPPTIRNLRYSAQLHYSSSTLKT
jgi:hypothetical protein